MISSTTNSKIRLLYILYANCGHLTDCEPFPLVLIMGFVRNLIVAKTNRAVGTVEALFKMKLL